MLGPWRTRWIVAAACILVLVSGCGLKLPDQINLPTELTGGDPKTLDAATAAGQEVADRLTSGDFAGVWLMMSKQVRNNINQSDYVTLQTACTKTGLPAHVTGVRMDNPTTAIVRWNIDLPVLSGFKLTKTMLYEDGKWVEAPDPDYAQDYVLPVDQIIAKRKASGHCDKSSTPTTPTTSAGPPGPNCTESDPDGHGGCLPWSPGLTTTTASQRPVAERDLGGLLLGPDQINNTMASTGMTVSGTFTSKTDASVSDEACLPLNGPAQPTVYADSGWSAMYAQDLHEPGDRFTHFVQQDLVLFSSAQDAGAFFAASTKGWQACANRQYDETNAGQPDKAWTTGPVSNTTGTLRATQTSGGSNDYWSWMSCQRALTVVNNVAVDVEACSRNVSDSRSDAAVNIAAQIATKVATA